MGVHAVDVCTDAPARMCLCVFSRYFRLYSQVASRNGADFLQLKAEIEAMVLTHFTLVYFEFSPLSLMGAARRGSREADTLW